MKFYFRTRLFIVAAAIVATVLAAVLLIGWNRVMAFEATRLDQRLCMEAMRLATQPMRSDNGPQVVTDLLNKLHLRDAKQVMFYLSPRGAGEVESSHNWQEEFANGSLTWRISSDEPASAAAATPPENRPLPAHPPPRPPLGSQEQQAQLRPPKPDPPQDLGPPRGGVCSLASITMQDRPWRAARYAYIKENSEENYSKRNLLAVDLMATQAEIQDVLKQAFMLVIPLALIFTALGAWLLAALTIRPVNRLRKSMQVVTQKALDQRLSSRNEDHEFTVLIDAYNTMLSRLENSFKQASRFSADAAHELRTPLTILQGRIEQRLHQTLDFSEQQELGGLLDEVGRLSDITRKLLLLSQVDAGYLALQRSSIDLSQMLADMTTDAQMLLSDQTLQCDIGEGLKIEGDTLLIRQLLNNLISNAVRYCRPSGWIRLTARAIPSGVEVVFSNATHVISQDQRDRFFDRFYRGDASHNRRIEGNGLGLSIAGEIARAHGGELILTTSLPDEVILHLTLPLS
jgi:two-component system, OmpR family, heavy metal sensor histidine kinase CusS